MLFIARLLIFLALAVSAQATTTYAVNLSRVVTSGPGGTLNITGEITVDDANTDNLIAWDEIVSYDLLYATTDVPADTHHLISGNSIVTGDGTVLGIFGTGLYVLTSQEMVLNSTNYLTINTSTPDPNSAIFSVSLARLDAGGGNEQHIFSEQFGLYGPPPFDAIGESFINQSELNTRVGGYLLGTEVPEPGSFALVLGGLLAAAGLARRRRR